MKQLIQRAAGSTFLRHNAIFFSGSIIVAFLNYLYYPVLGRLLTPADFGEVQAIFAFFMQTGVFMQVLGMVTIGAIKKYQSAEERRAVTIEIEWLAILLAVAGFVITLAASPWLKNFLHFSSVVPFIIFAFAVLLGVPLTFSNAYLQGLKRFGALAWSNIVAAASKLIFSAVLVIAGLATNGAVLGLALSGVVNMLYTHWLAAQVGRPRVTWLRRRPNLSLIRPELRYAGLVFVASLVVNLVLSIDIIAVKHYFPPEQAGLYAGISTVARILFFLTAPLTPVLVAAVKLEDPKHNRPLLVRSLTLLTLLGGSTLIFFTLFPDFTITLLMGKRYLVYAAQLPRLSLAIFILSFANLLSSYQVALRRPQIAAAASLGFVTMGILLASQHSSIPALVTSLIEGSVMFLILVIVAVSWRTKQGRATV